MKKNKQFISGVSILVGTCVGAGVLGIPYVAAQAGFLIALAYIILVGGIVLLANLYLGEVVLRTKGEHQLGGYAQKYIGRKGKIIMDFATIFGVYSAIVAYILGVSESFNFLFFSNPNFTLILGIAFGLLMSVLLWKGLKSLKTFEKWGVEIILVLFTIIIFVFIGKIQISNLSGFSFPNILLPFGVVLFAMMSFHSIPEINLVVKKDKKLFKRILVTGTLISMVFYILFALVVVGFKGADTPEIATFALGSIFVILGIFTMFTSYLALGNALRDHFGLDDHIKKRKSWILSAIIPIAIFALVTLTDFFSFTKILSIGGVVSGGLIAILTLLMVRKAKTKGDRNPEYSVPINWFLIILLSLVFVAGVVREIIISLN